MKSNTKKRLIAFMLCMVLVLSSATSAFADEPQNTDSQSQTEAVAEPAADEATGDEAAVNSSEQQQQEEQQPEQQQEQQQPEQQQPETEAPTVEAPAEQPAAEEAQPIQQLTYENDNVKITVDAVESGNIPEGATLSVTPIIKQEITDSMSDEEKTKAEELNNQYDFTENKLKEKAEDESYDIAGFLAYNITFVDADGNKMEPNGNVKVTMDYKQPVIAEDAVQTVNDTEWLNSTKDLDVTVLHLEEDNKGKVTDVVDMTAEDTNGDAEINTTSENEIQKVTITTNSFSTFAITYSNYSVTVKYVDQNGAEITSNQFTQNNVSIKKDKDIKISDKVKIPETVTIDNKTYQYSGAHLDGVSGENIYSIKVNEDGEWKYKVKSGDKNKDWNDGEGGTIYLVYQEQTQEQPTALPTVGTIDSTSKGITMRMINYDSPADGLSNDIGGPYTDNNKSGGIKQNLLNRVLTEGYPVTVGGTSLKTLFTGGTNVNHLFLQSSFDADGSYEYSSFKNYAHLEDNGDFTVYDALGTPSNEGYLWYRRGNFMPYNSISASDVSTNKNLYDESGNPLSDSDPAHGKTLYKTQGDNDYWFGMYVEADFNQPRNGQLKNGNMVYEFNGDDDLWVYVDGVLMLDIGGIHDAHSGSINFATGAITYDSVPGTTIKAQFQTAGVFPDGSAWDDSRVSEFFNGNTLKDFTEHNFKMFYMERGAGASNLKMKFNLEVIPTYEVNFNKVDTQGVALPGAEFEIRDDNDNSRVYNVTSGSNGGVSVRLHEGTYTMTETQAPTGYLAASGTWKIEVKSDGTYTIKKNGEEIAKDSKNVYKIVNKGQHEDAEANLTTSKTVKVKDYKKREYEITLGASTSGREAGTEAEAASVVLVLDRSGSMGTDGMTALVNAADTFIDTLKDASPDSQVAVVYFNGSQGEDAEASTTKVKEFTKLNAPANVKSIKDFLSNNQTPSGGTPMGNALKKAKSLLDADNTGNQQYVLFFTDGLPGYWDENDNKNCMVANSAVNYANDIKADATIYTVGYNLSKTSKKLSWHQGDSATSSADKEHGYYKYRWYYSNHDLSTSASDFLKDYIATTAQEGSNKKYAYTVDNTEDLGKEFKKLAAQIGAYYSINAEKIVDVIDARFELTEAGRKALVGDAKATTNEDGSKTYVKETRDKDNVVVGRVKITENTDGTTTIEWTGTEAHIGNKDNEADPAWEKKIGVVAKADFIGGNAVTTNTGDSGVFVNEDTTKMFPKPTVNVKALSLEMTGKSITVYKGDDLQPQAYYNQLAQTIKVVELDGTTKTLTGVKPVNKTQVSLPALTDAQKNELENKKTLTIGDGDNPKYKYIYPGTSDAVGYFKYIYTIPETPGGSIKDHKAGNAASPAEKYHLEVVFVPYTVEQRVAQNSGITAPAPDGGTVVSGNLTASADYIVNIIDGSIEITKVLETEPKGENGDTFTFTVTGPDNFSQDVSVTVTKDSLENGKYTATYNGDELKHLARGEYTVTEKVAAGYDVKSIKNDANTTNTKYVLNNPEDIHFTMGTVVENGKDVNVIKNYTYNSKNGGTLGKAIFTNESVYSDWQIIKVSASSHDVRLAGAIFELQSTADKNVKYYGKSGDAGIVKWYQNYQNNDVSGEITGKLPTGTYTLKEIKAPTGYTLSSNTYTLQITKTGALKTIQLNGENVAPALQDGKYQILIENTPLYDLPSAGGNGIYLYMIGGILLMFAAAWILYKNKCREVLER